MNSISIQALRHGLTMLCLLLLSYTGYSQAGTAVQMTFNNLVQTSPSSFEYDVYLTNTGTTDLKLRNYSWGLNPSNGLSNGGTLTHSFISRDASLSAIPIPGTGASTNGGQIRFTTLSVANASLAVPLASGVPVRLGTMRVSTSTSWPFPNFNPFLPVTGTAIQVLTVGGKTQCIANCIVTPPGVNLSINGTGNSALANTFQGLTASMTPDPTGGTPFVLNPCTAVVTHVSESACDSYTWPNTGLTYTATGTYFQTTSQGGSITCYDSTYLHLTLNSTTNTTPVSACDSYTWAVDGQSYSVSGTYSATSVNAANCTHTEIIVLTIQNSSNTSSTTACDSYTWAADGQTYTSSGTYTATSLNTAGCTHVETLMLTINNSTTGSSSFTACDSYQWPFDGQTYTSTGIYVATAVNAAGCTYTETLDLTVNSSTSSSTSATNCDSYTWNGTTYTTSGAYTQTSLNAAGCTHTETLNLTIDYSTSNSTSQTACDSYQWAVNNQTYSVSGTYTVTSTNTAGCTHSEILVLTINNSTSASSSATACDAYVWTVDGATYTTSGVYISTSTNAAGCLHTETLNLTVNYNTSGSSSPSACNTYMWAANGQTYSTSGTYTATSTNIAGCIHTETINLTVNYSSTGSSAHTTCDSYTWNGTTYTASGNPTHTYTNAVGCDSVHTLNLTILNSSSSSVSVTAYACYTWNLTNISYSTSGSYTTTFTNAVGCDSTVTLNVTIIPGITLSCKAMLAGPYNAGNGMMDDSLRVLGLLPSTEPYSGAPYFLAGGGQTVSPAVLAVSGPDAIVDWVYLELRDALTPSMIIATQRALIQRDGDVVSHMDGVSPVYFSGVPAANYYVSIKQRNHLGVMTPAAVAVTACAISVDFTSGTVWVKQDPQALQNAPRQLIGSVYALWAGDANVDKRVRGNGLSNDKTFLVTALGGNTNNVLYPVYRTEDMNMNGTIRYNGFNNDKNVIVNSIGLYTPNNTVYQHTPN